MSSKLSKKTQSSPPNNNVTNEIITDITEADELLPTEAVVRDVPENSVMDRIRKLIFMIRKLSGVIVLWNFLFFILMVCVFP